MTGRSWHLGSGFWVSWQHAEHVCHAWRLQVQHHAATALNTDVTKTYSQLAERIALQLRQTWFAACAPRCCSHVKAETLPENQGRRTWPDSTAQRARRSGVAESRLVRTRLLKTLNTAATKTYLQLAERIALQLQQTWFAACALRLVSHRSGLSQQSSQREHGTSRLRCWRRIKSPRLEMGPFLGHGGETDQAKINSK